MIYVIKLPIWFYPLTDQWHISTSRIQHYIEIQLLHLQFGSSRWTRHGKIVTQQKFYSELMVKLEIFQPSDLWSQGTSCLIIFASKILKYLEKQTSRSITIWSDISRFNQGPAQWACPLSLKPEKTWSPSRTLRSRREKAIYKSIIYKIWNPNIEGKLTHMCICYWSEGLWKIHTPYGEIHILWRWNEKWHKIRHKNCREHIHALKPRWASIQNDWWSLSLLHLFLPFLVIHTLGL